MIKKKVFYCSYDGLSDPLGKSQILPYLLIFKTFIHEIKVISFEKKKKINDIVKIKESLNKHDIDWKYFSFSRKLFFLGKIIDSIKFFLYLSINLLLKNVDIVHSRGYFPIIFLIFFKKFKNFVLIFDMRGLWFDEKKDIGSLNLNNIFHKFLFFILMKIEKKLIINSEIIVVLTERAKLEIIKKYKIKNKNIYVIPCCADYDFFTPLNTKQKQKQKIINNIPLKSKVICYLGSIGTWYMIDEMILFFEKKILKHNNNFYFLIISNDISDELVKLINLKNKKLNNRIILLNSSRENLPNILGCSDIMLSFIKPYYSKIASFPTKFAESLAMGIPVISNTGIGDIDIITNSLNAGKIVDLNIENNFTVKDLRKIMEIDPLQLREKSKNSLSLNFALAQYKNVYNTIVKYEK